VAVYTSQVLGGGEPGDFALVRRVQLSGTQREIGADLAEFAWTDHGIAPPRGLDPGVTRARRRWRETHWPELGERAKGVADRWNRSYDDNGYDFAILEEHDKGVFRDDPADAGCQNRSLIVLFMWSCRRSGRRCAALLM
jgi:hypothetical protein